MPRDGGGDARNLRAGRNDGVPLHIHRDDGDVHCILHRGDDARNIRRDGGARLPKRLRFAVED